MKSSSTSTFTVAIFTEFQLGFDTAAACVLSLVLVVMSIAVLGGELALSGPRPALSQRTRGPRGRRRGCALGRWTALPLAGLAAVAALALGVPGGALVYWLIQWRLEHAARRPRSSAAAGHTAALQRRRGGAGDGAGGAGGDARRPATATA